MDAPLRRRRGLSCLLSLSGLAVLAVAISPAGAQQVTAGKGSVTIDLGVLNQLGQPVTGGYAPYPPAGTYPQAYGQPAYSQPPYGQPAYSYPGQTYGGLLFPPQQYPVSTLTVQPPVGSVPYVPPASTANTAPAPAATTATTTTMPASAPAATAITEATPPPPPTPADDDQHHERDKFRDNDDDGQFGLDCAHGTGGSRRNARGPHRYRQHGGIHDNHPARAGRNDGRRYRSGCHGAKT
jgi:hypothetical protein